MNETNLGATPSARTTGEVLIPVAMQGIANAQAHDFSGKDQPQALQADHETDTAQSAEEQSRSSRFAHACGRIIVNNFTSP